MQHWIIDRQAAALPNWLEALPEAKLLGRSGLAQQRFAGTGVIWSRLHPGEPLDAALQGIERSGGQPLVLLCDLPDEPLILAALERGAAGCCNSRAARTVRSLSGGTPGNGSDKTTSPSSRGEKHSSSPKSIKRKTVCNKW